MAKSFLKQLLGGTLRLVVDQLNIRTRGAGRPGSGSRSTRTRKPKVSFKSPPGSRPAGKPSQRSGPSPGRQQQAPSSYDPATSGAPHAQPAREYRMPSDGLPRIVYAPKADGEPDPGEVLWAWVPYEEDAAQGKDRPVLIVARVTGGYLGCQMTSKDHDRDAEKEANYGRHWIDVGSGPWDSQRRDSEVRIDRLLFLTEDAVRREGANLPRDRFNEVATALTEFHSG